MNYKEEGFYRKIRAKIRAWIGKKGMKSKHAEYILLAPDFFHLLCALVRDTGIPGADKAKLAGAVAYFISPFDILPEAIYGPGGYIDDIALSIMVINGIINRNGPEIVRRNWAGDEDVLKVIKNIMEKADQLIGSGLLDKIKRKMAG
ncbi:MAG: DUF1232 domain-containing protein [bacterium]